MAQDDRFTHEKLQVYVAAREFLGFAHGVVRGLPRGEGELGDQLKRAALSVLLNTAEGAGRRERRDKAKFFNIARGSALECAAALDALGVCGHPAPADAARGRALLLAIVRMLTPLGRG